MIAGHFGLAVGMKKVAPRVPLWALLLGTFWLDIVFLGLATAGLETITPLDTTHPAYGEIIVHADYSHSLVGAALIATLIGWLAAWRWGKRGGAVVGAVVFSHWLLDLLVHRPDLPLLPGNLGHLPLLGFGLWQSPLVSALLEFVLVFGGAYLYHRSASQLPASDPRLQRRRVWTASLTTAILLVFLHVANLFGW